MYLFLTNCLLFAAEIDGEQITLPEVTHFDYGSAMVKMFLNLTVLIVLLFATFWFLKRIIQARQRKGIGLQAINILEKRLISPKSMLYLVEVEGKKILLAESQLEIRRLETWSHPTELQDPISK